MGLEIFPIIRSLNNTPIGQIANKAIMLEEFEKLMERNFSEYTDEWKRNKLAEELKKANIATEKTKKKPEVKEVKKERRKPPIIETEELLDSGEEIEFKRATDGKVYQDFISKSKSYPIQRIFNIYGIKFFLRVYLRKYKFSYIKDLVKSKSHGNLR